MLARTSVAVLSLLVLATVAALPSSGPLPGVEAEVVDVDNRGEEVVFDTLTPDLEPAGTTRWRVVAGTGNCCENYVMTAPDGTIFDFGGSYPYLSEDEGRTWRRVEPTTPLVNGEGTLAYAPNGDIVGVGWDPYTGDHLQAFKYDADSGMWLWNEIPLHLPFFDREWVTVVPGPIELDGAEYTWVSVLRGAWPSKDVLLISTDGLNYFQPSLRQMSALHGIDQNPLDAETGPYDDYNQTVGYSNFAPMGQGTLLAGHELLTGFVEDCPSSSPYVLRDEVVWRCHVPAEGAAVAWDAIDSTGRLHAARFSPAGTLEYVTSTDGGRTLHAQQVPFPDGYQLTSGSWEDLKANAAAGVVAITAHVTGPDGGTRDIVVTYRYPEPSRGEAHPIATAIHVLGTADAGTGAGLTSSAPRFDFSNLALLPDGRVVVSFHPHDHPDPMVAIQLDGVIAPLPTPVPPPVPSETETPAP